MTWKKFKISYILLNNNKCKIILCCIFLYLKKYTIVDIRILLNIKKDRMSLFLNLNLSFSLRILVAYTFQIVTILIIIINKIQNILKLYSETIIYLI